MRGSVYDTDSHAVRCDSARRQFSGKRFAQGWWVPLQAIKKPWRWRNANLTSKSIWNCASGSCRISYDSTRDLFDSLLASAGMTYKELQEKTWIMPPDGHPSKPYVRYEKGLLRPDGNQGFRTPSGKIELFSSWLEKWGLAPLPYHEEPPYSPVSTPDLFKEYPLILCTGRRMGSYFHSEHRQIPWLREQQKEPVLEIHPDTAEKLGIGNGEKVCVENWLGKITVTALTTPIIHPDVVMAEHGWWFPEKRGPSPLCSGYGMSTSISSSPCPMKVKAGWEHPSKACCAGYTRRKDRDHVRICNAHRL